MGFRRVDDVGMGYSRRGMGIVGRIGKVRCLVFIDGKSWLWLISQGIFSFCLCFQFYRLSP